MTILTNIDRLRLESAYKTARDKRTANHINILLLLDDGYSQKEVSDILRIDQSTVSRQLKQYESKDLDSYLDNPFSGGQSKLNCTQLESLEQFVEHNLCGSTDEVIEYVTNTFNMTYSRSGMAGLLRRLNFVYKRPTLIPGKADTALQESFVEYYNSIKESMSAKDKIYFLDGVHPQHNTVASSGWIRKGSEKRLKSNTGRKRININGALDAINFEIIARSDCTLNSESTIELLKMIEKNNPEANKIALIIDNAPYYYNGDVVEYAQNSKQLELIYLPPYSPNLNLIERVWRFMKKKVLHNKYHETFDNFKSAIGKFFKEFPSYGELSNLLTDEFQVFSKN